MRKQVSEEFKALSGAAQDAGVQNRMFGVFHDAGYKGLYGGLGRDAIKVRKRIPEKENLMDRMNATELAANQFRMTQTRDKLARDGIREQQQAIQTHEQVGREVRQAIQRIGGTPPENIPPAEHIKEAKKRLKGGHAQTGTGRAGCRWPPGGKGRSAMNRKQKLVVSHLDLTV